MLKHVIFDFDGVIADTHDINLSLSGKYAAPHTYEDFLAHHDGNVFEEPRVRFDKDSVHLFYSEYLEMITHDHISHAVEPLKRLAEDFSLYIISSNNEPGIVSVLQRSGVEKLFTRIMGEQTHKSKVEKFKILMAEHGVSPENSVFVTDTLGDIREAHKVQIRTIAETFGFHNRERLALGNPYTIVDSWEEIEECIHALAS